MFLMRSKVRRPQQQRCEGDANISQQIGGVVGCCRNIPTSGGGGDLEGSQLVHQAPLILRVSAPACKCNSRSDTFNQAG